MIMIVIMIQCHITSCRGLDSLLLLFLLLFLFLFLFFLLGSCFLTTLFLSLRSGSISRFLAGPLGPLLVLLFPDCIQSLCSDHLPASFIQLLPVVVCPGVCPPLILGVHTDHWRILSYKGFGIQTLLNSLLSQLSLLSLLQLLQFPLLIDFLLLIVILVSLKGNNNVEQFLSLGFQLVRVHSFKVERLDSDGEGDLLLLLQLLLGLGHLFTGVTAVSTNCGLLAAGLLLLSLKHLLPLGFSLLKTLLLLLSLNGLLLILFFPQLLFLFLLLLVKLLLLLSSDLLPLSLLLLQLHQLLLLLLPGLPPFCDVFLEGGVQSLLLLCLLICHDCTLVDPWIHTPSLDDTAPDVLDRVPM